MEKHSRRLALLSLGVFFLFSLLIAQFFYVQIVQKEKWSQAARKQHFFTIDEPFLRGTFYSNADVGRIHPDNDQRLVLEIEKFHLCIDPLSIPEKNRKDIIAALLEKATVAAEEKEALELNFEKQSRSRKVVRWLNSETKEQILQWWNPYARRHKIPRNALYFVVEYQRSYPYGKLLGQVLSTVQDRRDEKTKAAFPTGGLELYFDGLLQGRLGKRLLKRSPRHSFEIGEELAAPEDGKDIYLTVNHCLQAIVEEELERGVKQCGAKGATAVMMDPWSGSILALGQYPFFHPERYREYFNDQEKVENTKVKAVTDILEPGSVIKPFTALAALMANQELAEKGERPFFDPEQKMPCSNPQFHGRSKPLQDVRLHKYLNLDMAMQKSSNIYFARLAEQMVERLGPHWYRTVLEEKFGFGLPTGIEIPGECPGILPRLGKRNPNGTLQWSVPTPFSLAIGYNLQLNAVQIARSWSLLANGGRLVKPTLVRKIVRRSREGESQVIFEMKKEKRGVQVVDPPLVARVKEALRYTTKPGGSGRRADIFGYTEVGKTGTAHKLADGAYSQSYYVASFAGFAPVARPAFVLVVVIDEPEKKFIPGVGNNHHGSVAAAPVFKAIATRALEYLGITPDDPYGYPYGDPRRDPRQADWVEETTKLQRLYEAWNG